MLSTGPTTVKLRQQLVPFKQVQNTHARIWRRPDTFEVKQTADALCQLLVFLTCVEYCFAQQCDNTGSYHESYIYLMQKSPLVKLTNINSFDITRRVI